MKIKRKSFQSLTVSIPLRLIAVVTVMLVLLSAVVIGMTQIETTKTVQAEVDYLARMNASKINSYLENMKAFSHALSKEVRHYSGLERAQAEPILIETLKDVLDDDKIFGAYFAFEPNRYFEDTPDGLSYYAYRSGGSISVDILTDHATYSAGDYYIGARDSMQTYVTEPYPYELSNGQTVYLITLSTPVTDRSGTFLGVANCDILAESINGLSFENGGYQTAYTTILSRNGMCIADSADKGRIGSPLDTSSEHGQRLAQAVRDAKPLLTLGENEHDNGAKAIIHYIPITLEGSNLSWSSGLTVSRAEVFEAQHRMTAALFVLSAVGILLLCWFTNRIIKRSLAPVPYVMELAERMRRCDLSEDTRDIRLPDDELGQLARIFQKTREDLVFILTDFSRCLDSMAQGSFRVESDDEARYVGAYRYLLADMKRIRGTLSATLAQIDDSSEQVRTGAEQVADGAQALSQGATEQAASIEELVGTISELSDRIRENAQEADLARSIAEGAGADVTESNQHMQELLDAMKEINDASTEIGRIIKTIDSIAFQTNILALNAAVEAARAGAAGKGFAVVADEVRNLASKSAEAAKDTTELIQRSFGAVEHGGRIANRTAQSLEKVVEQVHEAQSKIEHIADASMEQAGSVERIELGIDQISSVVQTNSATAQQSAAASEELSGQASLLKSLMTQFTLWEGEEEASSFDAFSDASSEESTIR